MLVDRERTVPSGPEQAVPSGPEQAVPSGPEPAVPSGPEPAVPSGPEQAAPSGPEQAAPSGPEQAVHSLEQLEQLVQLDQLDHASGIPISSHLRTMWEANCSCRAAGYSAGGTMRELQLTWGEGTTTGSNGSTCSGLPSPVDVPTRSQAAARESAAEVLRKLRQLAGLVWPDHAAAGANAAGADSGGRSGSSVAAYADWEVLQAELLSVPAAFPALCDEGLWCCNPACTNLEGPSELALKTQACGGGCRVRYCSPECQAQAWRDGHRLSCGQLRDRRSARCYREEMHSTEAGGAEHCHRAAATTPAAADG